MHVRLSLAVVAAVSTLGCVTYEIPTRGPGEELVFEAARRAILKHYPTARPLEKSGLVLAVTEPEMYGAYKSRRQITVHIRQLYTGSWEPTVRIVRFIEVGEPILGTDPEASVPGPANPVAVNRWQPLQHLPSEELAMLQEIRSELSGGTASGPSPDSAAASPGPGELEA